MKMNSGVNMWMFVIMSDNVVREVCGVVCYAAGLLSLAAFVRPTFTPLVEGMLVRG